MSFSRLRKAWLPATGILCATGGLAFLALAPDRVPGPPPATWTAAAPAGRQVERPAAGPGRRAPARAARGARRAARPATTAGQAPPLSRKARAARGLAQALTHTPALHTRLALLKSRIATLPPEPALVVLEGLLETPLKGTQYEVQAVRLAALGHIGRLPGPEASAALVAHLDAEEPRPERLVAIELLAARHAARAELKRLARGDHDLRVQQRAEWALGR